MEADVAGTQRKIIASRVEPVRAAHGDSGIATRGGRTLPFEVERTWSAPAGYYPEQWFLVVPETREVLYESPAKQQLIFGLQGPTTLRDVVSEPFDLAPGSYLVVFALGGLRGGDVTVEAREVPREEAA